MKRRRESSMVVEKAIVVTSPCSLPTLVSYPAAIRIFFVHSKPCMFTNLAFTCSYLVSEDDLKTNCIQFHSYVINRCVQLLMMYSGVHRESGGDDLLVSDMAQRIQTLFHTFKDAYELYTVIDYKELLEQLTQLHASIATCAQLIMIQNDFVQNTQEEVNLYKMVETLSGMFASSST